MKLSDFKKTLKEAIENKDINKALQLINEFYDFRLNLIKSQLFEYLQKIIAANNVQIEAILSDIEYLSIQKDLESRFNLSKDKMKELVLKNQLKVIHPLIFTAKKKYLYFNYERPLRLYYARKLNTLIKLKQGYSIYKVSIHNTSCPICSQYEGKFLVNGSSNILDSLDLNDPKNRPPYHLHCKHTLIPVPKDIYESI